MTNQFSEKLLSWYDRHGRKDLPWQKERSAYRVWVSEIMLQQTQVATVIPYYTNFMQRFPDVAALANAELDDVLQHWSGLGYYARARNLHKAAQQIRDQHAGQFPTDYEAVLALPGIGRSTAGAILAQAHGQRHPILDGNVKRVLTRYFTVAGWPGEAAVAGKLWAHADALTPQTRVADYTQAIMDLGAIICTRTKPVCNLCPVSETCSAHRENSVARFPTERPKKQTPVRKIQMLILLNDREEFLLERRPPVGIWGGLLGFPEIPIAENPADWAEQHIGDIVVYETWAVMRHTFSHFHLDITPVIAVLINTRPQVMDESRWLWYNSSSTVGGLAAPVKKLMQHYQAGELHDAQRPMRKTG